MIWNRQHVIRLMTLVFAGEMIFSLPFHTARFFRATLLQTFHLSNTQLGDLFAVYGVTAFISYIAGGPLADRYSARGLMCFSLIATSAGGFYMASFPGPTGLSLLYAWWGVTTILLFWAALIRATRALGGVDGQGRAFGLLDGGRGLVAAVVAMLAVAVLAAWLPQGSRGADAATHVTAFRNVILFYSAVTLLAGVLSWLLLPAEDRRSQANRPGLAGLGQVLRRPVVWAQAGVIIAAYCAFKGLDNFSLYGVQVLGLDEVTAARETAWAAYSRPVACVLAGWLADRYSAPKVLIGSFLVSIAGYAILALSAHPTTLLLLIYLSALVCFSAAFAMRGVYFALLQETHTPRGLTGTTVGVVSFFGFTPEIFFGPVTGRILDSAPGVAGHQAYFAFLAGAMVFGVMVTITLTLLNRSARQAEI